jgi:type VI secretion system secreted protein Hcp
MNPAFYVTVEGIKQGTFKGESAKKEHKTSMEGHAFQYEVKPLLDAATGHSSGKRQHGPVTFVKKWGAATPQLFQALFTNEELKTVLFEFVRTTIDGAEEVDHTVTLRNAIVSGIKQYIGNPAEQGAALDGLELNEVAFVFRSIEIEDRIGKMISTDTFGNQ